MNILLTGFRGTSSELLVKKSNYKSVIMPNDKVIDSRILLEKIRRQKYDYVFSFGQKPNINVLRYIIDKKSEVRMIFCHIPFYKNMTYPESFFDCILHVIERKV